MKKFWERNGKIIMPAVITILMGYTGYGEYQKRQEPASAVTVNVSSIPANSSTEHPDVAGICREIVAAHANGADH